MINNVILAFASLMILLAQAPAVGQPEPGRFIVFEEKFAPNSRALVMKAQREVADMWKVHNPGMPVYTWQNDNSSLYRMMPVSGFASIDTLYRKMEQLDAILKADSLASVQRPVKQTTVSGMVMIWVPELSHQQEPVFGPYPERPYSEWMIAYLLSDQQKQAEEALMKFRNYYVENRLDYPWDTFRVLFGNDTPVLIGLFRAESPTELQIKGKRIWEKHGVELDRLWNNVVRHTWKIENKTGWFNQSLSNMPLPVPEEEVMKTE